MQRVLYAMAPGIGVLIWVFGWGVVVQLILASMTAFITEAVVLGLRGKPLRFYLGDCSALVTAWLLAVAIPALAPWWVIVVGVSFAIVVAKHLYGGLGYNPFNPAMVGYVVLLISFPLEMNTWPSTQYDFGLAEAVQVVFWGPSDLALDAITAATPLDTVKTQLHEGLSMADIASQQPVWGVFAGRHWEWPTLAFLGGGLWLVYTRTAAWQMPLAMLVSLATLAGIFFIADPQANASPWFHVFSFSSIYGAFFIATDPVSAATTPHGRLLYGAGIGILTYIIRSLGAYPDGVAFAVLLMNITAPTIDYYTQPRVFGARR
jgi:electron transport complex protein RnfD